MIGTFSGKDLKAVSEFLAHFKTAYDLNGFSKEVARGVFSFI